jgi:N-acetylglucosamine kinase-like BadF-type ATPase
MFIVADSGSTKCDWAIIDSKVQTVQTDGINPYFEDDIQIQQKIANTVLPIIAERKTDNLFFYGSGCRKERSVIMQSALCNAFNCKNVEINTDLTGAARALFGNKAGIACILGTGSNSGLYDGKEIVDNIPPLGFILGDEGSAAVICREFLSNLLKNQLSNDIKNKFFRRYELSVSQIIEGTYCNTYPNRFLAQFMPFLKENIEYHKIYDIVFNSFILFIKKNIMNYPNFQSYNVSFCGSVAYNFSTLLTTAAERNGIKVEKIVASPLERLVEMHQLQLSYKI